MPHSSQFIFSLIFVLLYPAVAVNSNLQLLKKEIESLTLVYSKHTQSIVSFEKTNLQKLCFS